MSMNLTTGGLPPFDVVAAFHGHICPGLATGYRVAVAAMQMLGVGRPYDEELVAIAETDACGVDAIQCVTGCTAGKGNLIIKDYGKSVFTFIRRDNGRAVRIVASHPALPEEEEMNGLRKKITSGNATARDEERWRELMENAAFRILSLPEDEVLTAREVEVEIPERARIFESIPCACCGEMVADAKTKVLDGKRVCIPCYEAGSGGRV